MLQRAAEHLSAGFELLAVLDVRDSEHVMFVQRSPFSGVLSQRSMFFWKFLYFDLNGIILLATPRRQPTENEEQSCSANIVVTARPSSTVLVAIPLRRGGNSSIPSFIGCRFLHLFAGRIFLNDR